MAFQESDINFDNLHWKQFEELCYELLTRSNFHSLVWRQGGADQGRDIEAKLSPSNSLVKGIDQTWFVECKHHSSSLNVEHISTKIAWADANRPDYFLLITSSYLTNDTRSWLELKSKQVQYKIKLIEGKELKQRILEISELVEKYFINNQIAQIRSIKRQWLYHDIMPDEVSFYKLFCEMDIPRMSSEDLVFMLFAYHELEERIDEFCENEGLAKPSDIKILLALRKHKNHNYPIVSEKEMKKQHLSFPTPHYRTIKMERKEEDLMIFILHETINHNQLLDVMIKRDKKEIEVRVSLRE